METIKEILTPLFRDCARIYSSPVFDEACSKPWFLLPVSIDGLHWDKAAEPDRANYMIHCGGNLFISGEGLSLPYREQVIVRKKPTGMWMVQYVAIDRPPQRGRVQNVSGKLFEYHPDDGGRYTVSDCSQWDAERAESFILLGRQLGKWMAHPSLHLASVAPLYDDKTEKEQEELRHFEFLHPYCSAQGRHASWERWSPFLYEPETLRRRAKWRGPKRWVNRPLRRIYCWVDKTTLGNGKEDAHASA